MEFSQAGCVGTGERDYGVQRRPERNVWRNAEEGISGVWCIVGTGARGDTSSRRGGASGARSDPQRDEGGPHIRRKAGRGFLQFDGELFEPPYELSSDAGSGAQSVPGEGLSPLRSYPAVGMAVRVRAELLPEGEIAFIILKSCAFIPRSIATPPIIL